MRVRRAKLSSGLCAALVALALAGCGASGTSSAPPATRTFHVTIVRDARTVGRYVPATITVRVGDRIVFRNAGDAPHTVSETNGVFDSGTIFVGKSWVLTARKPGRFSYFCQFHPGMNGTVIVKGA
ncbi:MAG TPA: cupredoxin domain-containing protein [Chloroflexota bacterium]|nr:cupredoxin domain-containing protein [Chloroflexota bacterium]